MEAHKLDNQFVFKMNENANKQDLNEALEALDGAEGSIEIVLDFSTTEFVERSFFAPLNQLKIAMKKALCSYSSINIDKKLEKDLENQGVLLMFNYGVKAKPAKQKKMKIDMDFINPFISSTIEMLDVQCSVKADKKNPYIKTPDSDKHFEIIGVIAIKSNIFKGNIALCLKTDTFLKIYEGMLGEKHETVDDEMIDCVGEILNIIFGMGKAALNDKKDYQIEKAIPTVMHGNDLKVRQQMDGLVLAVPFESSAGDFQIEIELANID